MPGPPALLQAGFQTQLKSPHQSRSVSTQPCRAGGMCLGGSSVEGSQGGARHAVFPDSPEIPAGGRDSLWAHLYFNYFSDCSLRRAMAGGQIQQHCSGFSLQLPPILSTGWAGCCVCPAPGRARAAWKHPAAQAVGVERAARQAHVPFIPVRLQATG